MGVPRIGRARTSAAGDLTQAPKPELLGSIPLQPQKPPTFDEDGPPPWELDPKWGRDSTNARQFVTVPGHWELRWLNPKRVDQAGMRDWKTVSHSDKRVKVKIPEMKAPDGTIRRNGHQGDFLAYMPKTWLESRRQMMAQRRTTRSGEAIDRQKEVVERINRGDFGPHIQAESAKHPTHTILEGATVKD